MKKFLKWTGLVVAGLIALAGIGIGYLYAASESRMHQRFTVAAPAPLPLPTDPADISEGHRLAHLTGCTHCHAENLGGFVPLDIPHVVRFVAPNLTTTVPNYSDSQLITLLRKGVKPDGTSVYFMPSEMIRHLSDADLARVIAWVRSVPRTEGITGKTEVRLIGRFIIATGQYKSAAEEIQSRAAEPPPAGLSDSAAHGRYRVMSSCTECHGQDLNGNPDAKAPPLAIAKAYSAEQFSALMREGRPLSGQELELMSPTARARFASFTTEEIAAVYEFLQSRR